MAAPYTSSPPSAWQQEMRSVTPATNNTRNPGNGGRYASAPRMGGSMTPSAGNMNDPYAGARSMTPNRYVGGYNRHDDTGDVNGGAMTPSNSNGEPRTPSSTGLIRLSLKKPMGIVFEPMYDPNQPSVQRGVRICDLPRTGAAALSRKLQVGDELLQINDTTVSRLTFDEIMDFIIEADPESVNLLFRRPRKETLQARQGVQQKINAAVNKDNPSTVKWVDEERGDKKKSKDRKGEKKKGGRKNSKRSKKDSGASEEDTLQSSTAGEESYEKRHSRSRKKSKSRRDPYESESFLDLLIDTICSNSNNVCRDTFRRHDEEEFSEDDESFNSEAEDESTYVTYEESSVEGRGNNNKNRKKEPLSDYTEAEDDTVQEKLNHRRHKQQRKEKSEKNENKLDKKKKYEDDGTLETVDSNDRIKPNLDPPVQPPLGLAPPPPQPTAPEPVLPTGQSDNDDDGNPAPIKELEYDDRIDHGADVSVMESLGGPSLLIEKQRAAAQAAAQKSTGQTVPSEITDKFGLDYPANFGMTREQAIEADPLKYYTYVVKGLLEEFEPEKVRLLDKLLAKYKGREDHLVQKLSVRYNRVVEEGTPTIPEEHEHDDVAFTDAVKKSKASSAAAANVNTARELMQSSSGEEAAPEEPVQEWPEKEEKEPDEGDGEGSESGSEYSGDSVDGTSPAVIAQVSELLNYVYGKTSVPGQIDRVSTIMRAYEGREAVLLELLETKALIKANKEKENTENLPSFLRNSTQVPHKNPEELGSSELPPVTPMATQPQSGTVINDDISSMSGVSSPAVDRHPAGIVNQSPSADEVEVTHFSDKEPGPVSETPKITSSSSNSSVKVSTKPPATPDKERKKKKGLFGGLFGKKKHKDSSGSMTPGRAGSRTKGRKLKGVTSVEGSI